jgi:hypothetical protein
MVHPVFSGRGAARNGQTRLARAAQATLASNRHDLPKPR